VACGCCGGVSCGVGVGGVGRKPAGCLCDVASFHSGAVFAGLSFAGVTGSGCREGALDAPVTARLNMTITPTRSRDGAWTCNVAYTGSQLDR
jgi:hypothetical protein